MDSGRKSRYGGGEGGGQGSREPDGVGVGKRTLTQGIGSGEGKQPAARKEAPGEPKAEQDPQAAGKDPQATDDVGQTEASGGDGQGKQDKQDAEGSGFGFSDFAETVTDAANGAIGGALAAAGVASVNIKTKEASPSGVKDRTQVGVGEEVSFTSNMPGKWKCDKIAPGFSKKGTGDSFLWFAPETKGTAKITFDAGKKGVKPVEIEMKILEPKVDYLNPRKVPFDTEAPGATGVNMETDVTFLPLDVSFVNTMWWEKPGPASNSRGYFRDHVTKRGFQLPFHNPAEDDIEINNKNSGITDTAGWWDFNPPYYAGGFEWVIPTYYRVLDGERHLIKNVRQICSMDDSGSMTVTKESASLTRTI